VSEDHGEAVPTPILYTSERPLNDAELRELREMMEADRRLKWFWATTRRIAIWVAAVAGTFSVGWDMVVRLVLHVTGK